jgi:hypothetical protein
MREITADFFSIGWFLMVGWLQGRKIFRPCVINARSTTDG